MLELDKHQAQTLFERALAFDPTHETAKRNVDALRKLQHQQESQGAGQNPPPQ